MRRTGKAAPAWCDGCAWLRNGAACEVFKDANDPWLTEDGKCGAYALPEQRERIERTIKAYEEGRVDAA